MSFKRFWIHLILIALATGLSVSASAAVKWPYQLDPAFSTNGYDTIGSLTPTQWHGL